MKQSIPFAPFADPWLEWSALAWKTGEMMLASAQVINHRVTRLAAAGIRPNARDRREFSRMGYEKIEAALASTRAVAANATARNAQLGLRGFEQLLLASNAWIALASSRTAGDALARQARLVGLLTGSGVAASKLSRSAARLFHAGMLPLHARATANARRLSRRRP